MISSRTWETCQNSEAVVFQKRLLARTLRSLRVTDVTSLYKGALRCLKREFTARRVSRAEPNKNLTKEVKTRITKKSFKKLQNQSALSTQFDTDHSDLPQ